MSGDERDLVGEYFPGGDSADPQADDAGDAWDEGEPAEQPKLDSDEAFIQRHVAAQSDAQFVARHVAAAEGVARATPDDGGYYEADADLYGDAAEPQYDDAAEVPPQENPQLAQTLAEFEKADPQGFARLCEIAGVEPPPQLSQQEQVANTIAAATSASLAELAEVQQQREARLAANDAQAQQQQQAELNEARAEAHGMIHEALARHDARSFNPEHVEVAANAILESWGVDADSLPDYQRVEVAQLAIEEAAKAAGQVAITRNVLDRHFPTRRRT